MLKPTLRSVTQRALDVLGLSASSRLHKKARVLTAAEYWVYLPKPALPPQDQVMTFLYDNRLIGPAEGLVLSDVRLLNVLVLRSKNQRLFRKDLLLEAEGFNEEILSAVSKSEALCRVCFISEEAVDSDSYLSLLPNLCLAISDLGEGTVIFDLTQQRIFTTEAFRKEVKARKQASDFELHVRSIWDATGPAPIAYTLGLHKRGLPDLTTGPMEVDAKNLALHLLCEAASELWRNPNIAYELPQTRDFEYFDQDFKVVFERRVDGGKLLTRLYRQVPNNDPHLGGD